MDIDILGLESMSGFFDELEKIAFASRPSSMAMQSSMSSSVKPPTSTSPLGTNLSMAAKPPKMAVPGSGIINKTTASGAIVNPGNSQSISANAIGPKATPSVSDNKSFSPPSIS